MVDVQHLYNGLPQVNIRFKHETSGEFYIWLDIDHKQESIDSMRPVDLFASWVIAVENHSITTTMT